jgi:membrane protein implicated in regulation of membrane protease activity
MRSLLRPKLLRREPGSEYLNRRAEQMIGQRYVLIEPIVNGRGKASVGDGQWLVSGADLPVGSTVEVVAVDGTTLQVRAVA